MLRGGDLPDQRASAASFPILTEADYSPQPALTHLGQIHKPPLMDGRAMSAL